MERTRTNQSASHDSGTKKASGLDRNFAPQPEAAEADSPTAKPQGTLEDQVNTMESEGQAQPQEGDRTPEELEQEATDNKAGG
jgi:hypothetical protein